jgi:hypothetical protein
VPVTELAPWLQGPGGGEHCGPGARCAAVLILLLNAVGCHGDGLGGRMQALARGQLEAKAEETRGYRYHPPVAARFAACST